MVYTLEKAKILVVDDMQPMLSLTKSLLSIFGFKNVYGATDGNEAFEIFCKQNPDLVISDWVMEPMDGMELIEKIRKDSNSPNPYVPVIIMTGFSSRLRVETARDTGITEFLVKPFTSKDLYSKIEHVIERPRQFVDAGSFFGPDRRRKRSEDYEGPRRREEDMKASKGPQTKEDRIAAEVLKKLIQETKQVS